MLRQNRDLHGHDANHREAGKPGEKTEEKGKAHNKLAGEKNHDKKRRPSRAYRRRPRFDRPAPARTAEPSQRALRPVKEKECREGQSKNERPTIPRAVKK